MAIKIIEKGKIEKFTKTCPNCGCKFEYEQGDVKNGTYVICPCCGKHLPHNSYMAYYNYPNVNYIPPEKGTIVTNCDNCPNKLDPKNVTTGDSPCDWCIKRHFACK